MISLCKVIYKYANLTYRLIFVFIIFTNCNYAYKTAYSNLFGTVDAMYPGNTIENKKSNSSDIKTNYGLSGGYLYSLDDQLRVGFSLSYINGNSPKVQKLENVKITSALDVALYGEYDFYKNQNHAFFTYFSLGYSFKSAKYTENLIPDMNPDADLYLWTLNGQNHVDEAKKNDNYCVEVVKNDPSILLTEPTNQIIQNPNNIFALVQDKQDIASDGSTNKDDPPKVVCGGLIEGYRYEKNTGGKNIQLITRGSDPEGCSDSEGCRTELFLKRRDISISSLSYSLGMGYRKYINRNIDFLVKIGYQGNWIVKPNSNVNISYNAVKISTGFTYKFFTW